MNRPDDRPGLGRRLAHELRPYRRQVTAIFALDLLATPLMLLTPVPVKIAVDSVLGDAPLPAFLTPLVPDAWVASDLGLLLFAAAMQVLVVVLVSSALAGYGPHEDRRGADAGIRDAFAHARGCRCCGTARGRPTRSAGSATRWRCRVTVEGCSRRPLRWSAGDHRGGDRGSTGGSRWSTAGVTAPVVPPRAASGIRGTAT
jgi:hypothetical protein